MLKMCKINICKRKILQKKSHMFIKTLSFNSIFIEIQTKKFYISFAKE